MKMDVIDRVAGAMMAHPDQHNQSSYSSLVAYHGAEVFVTEDRVPPCGSTCCAAGWMVFTEAEKGTYITGNNSINYMVVPPRGRAQQVRDWAQETCGATPSQAEALFGAITMTPDEWYALAKELNDEETR